MSLADKIKDKTAIIGVVGLGYVGLPLAMAFAKEGFWVDGFDNDVDKVKKLRLRETDNIDIDINELHQLIKTDRLHFNSKFNHKWYVDVVIICVPTPLTNDKKPDLSHIKSAVKWLKGKLSDEQEVLIVLESSTSPGTTRDIVAEKLKGDKRFFAYSPERVNPGDKVHTLRNTPKLAAGIDIESTELVELLYSQVVDKVVVAPSLSVAETAKLFENIFRNVNIALVNELTLICESLGISSRDVIDMAATKPFGFMPFYPGPGVQGHCLPCDPYYLLEAIGLNKDEANVITESLATNEIMPEIIADKVFELLDSEGVNPQYSTVLILGITFKPNVRDTRGSSGLIIASHLRNMGVKVNCIDPYVDNGDFDKSAMDMIEKSDCVVLVTDHDCLDYQVIADSAKLIYDTRGAFRARGITGDHINTLGGA